MNKILIATIFLLMLSIGCSNQFTEQDAQALYVSDVIKKSETMPPQEAVDELVDAMWLYYNAPNYSFLKWLKKILGADFQSNCNICLAMLYQAEGMLRDDPVSLSGCWG